jgi:hypothetical protein
MAQAHPGRRQGPLPGWLWQNCKSRAECHGCLGWDEPLPTPQLRYFSNSPSSCSVSWEHLPGGLPTGCWILTLYWEATFLPFWIGNTCALWLRAPHPLQTTEKPGTTSGGGWPPASSWEPVCLGSSSRSAAYQLWNTGQVISWLLWDSVLLTAVVWKVLYFMVWWR